MGSQPARLQTESSSASTPHLHLVPPLPDKPKPLFTRLFGDESWRVDNRFTIDQKLKLEMLRRNFSGAYFTVPISFALWMSFWDEPVQPACWPWIIYALIINALFRVILQLNTRDPAAKIRYYNLGAAGNLISATCWSVGLFSVISTYGTESEYSHLTWMLVCLLMTTGISSQAPAPRLAMTNYWITFGAAAVSTFLFSAHPLTNYLGYFSIVGVAFMHTNIRKQARYLRTSYELEEKLKNVISSIPGFVAVSDVQNRWIEKSASFADFQNNQILMAAKEEFIKSGLPTKTHEFDWTPEDFHDNDSCPLERSYAVSFRRTTVPEGGAIMVGLPITELRVAQRAQANIKEQEKEKYHLLVKVLSHDIGNGLTMISGYLNRLKKVALGEHETRAVVKIGEVVTNVMEVLHFVRQEEALKSFDRTVRLEKVDLNLVTKDMESFFEDRFKEKNLKVSNTVPPQTMVMAEKTVLANQILSNLFSNALKFSKPGGELKIYSEEIPEFVCLKIRDYGVGIKKELIDKIFFSDDMVTTPGTLKEKGSGIGSSLIREYMKKFNGVIEVQSVHESESAQSGTLITLKFPKIQ